MHVGSSLRRSLAASFATVTLAAASVATLGVAPVAEGKTRAGCGVKGAKTVVRNANSRVVVLRSDEDDLYGGDTEIITCHGSRGEAQQIDAFTQVWPTFEGWTIRGRYAAYALGTWDSACDKYVEPEEGCHPNYEIVAVDTKTGRRIVKTPTPGFPSRLIVTGHGRVAWAIAAPNGSPAQQLWVARRSVPPRLITTSATLDPTSIRLTSTSVSWTDAASTTTAPLP